MTESRMRTPEFLAYVRGHKIGATHRAADAAARLELAERVFTTFLSQSVPEIFTDRHSPLFQGYDLGVEVVEVTEADFDRTGGFDEATAVHLIQVDPDADDVSEPTHENAIADFYYHAKVVRI